MYTLIPCVRDVHLYTNHHFCTHPNHILEDVHLYTNHYFCTHPYLVSEMYIPILIIIFVHIHNLCQSVLNYYYYFVHTYTFIRDVHLYTKIIYFCTHIFHPRCTSLLFISFISPIPNFREIHLYANSHYCKLVSV